jgi:hypothetical protein
MPDAPSESEAQCCSIPGNIFNFVPGNGARNVGDRSHPGLQQEQSPTPISLCHDLFNGVIEWKLTQNDVF